LRKADEFKFKSVDFEEQTPDYTRVPIATVGVRDKKLRLFSTNLLRINKNHSYNFSQYNSIAVFRLDV
jgi:hypothetical protein